MRFLTGLSGASALLFILTGCFIAGNDLFIGVASTVPVVSAIVSLIFIAIGVLLGLLGLHASRLAMRVMPEGLADYRRLTLLLQILFALSLLVAAGVFYGVVGRVGQGMAIFG